MVRRRFVGHGGQRDEVDCPHLCEGVLVDEQVPRERGRENGTFSNVDRMPSESGAFPYEPTLFR